MQNNQCNYQENIAVKFDNFPEKNYSWLAEYDDRHCYETETPIVIPENEVKIQKCIFFIK